MVLKSFSQAYEPIHRHIINYVIKYFIHIIKVIMPNDLRLAYFFILAHILRIQFIGLKVDIFT